MSRYFLKSPPRVDASQKRRFKTSEAHHSFVNPVLLPLSLVSLAHSCLRADAAEDVSVFLCMLDLRLNIPLGGRLASRPLS